MLIKLYIKNFILIQDLSIDFQSGMTSIIGETGAGKSVLLKSLFALFAKKVSSDIVYNKDELTIISAVFDISKNTYIQNFLNENDILFSGSEKLIIKRIISHDSRNKIFINEQPASTENLLNIKKLLFDICTQHHQSKLIDKKTHIDILDNYINDQSLNEKIAALFYEWERLKKLHDTLILKQKQNKHEIFYLQQMINEITALKLESEEFSKICQKREKIKEGTKIFNITSEANIMLSKRENSTISELWQIHKNFLKYPEIFHTQASNLESAIIELESLNDDVAKISIELSKDQEQAENIESRFFRIKDLAQKYNIEPEKLSSIIDEATEKLNNFKNLDVDLHNIATELTESAAQYLKFAKIMSDKRKKYAKKLTSSILHEAREMNMSKLDMKINVNQVDNWSDQGIDDVEIIIQTNPGKDFSSIKKIASGGELSRLLLAIKLVVSPTVNQHKTIIFDEIDSGTGGKTAQAIANKLNILSTQNQIVLITHQPQIAAISKHILKVKKYCAENQVSITVNYLHKAELTEEISYMITGNDHGKNTSTIQQLLNLK